MAAEPSITAASTTGSNDDNVIFGQGQTEAERNGWKHKVIFDSMPQLVTAPIDLSKGGLKILDQATATGIWIRDVRSMANGAKNTWVGTDIADYFPSDPPSDTSYHHHSMTEVWPEDWIETFGLVHSRFALPGVGTNKLEDTVNSLISLVKPGGWIQLVEMDWDNWNLGPEGQIFRNAIKDLFSLVSVGQGVDLREKETPMLKEAGLQNIDYKIVTTPFCARASEKIRETSEKSLFATAIGVTATTKMLPHICVPREKLDVMPQKLLEEAKKIGWEYKIFSLWAQKPEK
ncbi:hypothetical protein BU23DRAFT_627396 [Bimuria novae-zelandiae CBS 107.79]|uniref:S-adenosyl-L-methionine-dependent methyltransferase n=1 Tax=Bimuria novae-zelandiae CBS 107.79 TaxID=1447943 RepID=A0A6A5UK13_9PLEO|nr:hypothetical protein BU23DRAFT_627396 [Bimuria novae-zelandiae CBS 107.79]